MKRNVLQSNFTLATAMILMLVRSSALAGSALYDFSADPTADPDLQFGGNGVNPMPWQPAGGDPGGFLALTYPMGTLYEGVIFPDIDPGKIVTAFTFECDLRVGNSTGERAADGFSINFARADDPVLTDISVIGGFASGIAEAGTTTGIAIGFDTWAGNGLPDGPDIEGIIVRVDNKTVLRQSLPTRHGDCTNATSLQTGPRDQAYWDGGGDPTAPGSWATLCWQPLRVELDDGARLTVQWKNNTVLDHFQTTYFPSPGRLVLAGRTGGANEHTHFDNIRLTTVATTVDTNAPTAPTGFQVDQTGARRLALSWNPATDDSGRVAYELERNGQVLPRLLSETNYVDLDVKPATAYAYRVRATDVSRNNSDWATVSATTVAEVDGPGFPLAEIYDAIPGASVDDLATAPGFPANPDRGRYLSGLSFGEPAFLNTLGDNLGVRIATVLTAPETAQYDFFIRSDDASRLYLNTTGPAIPDPNSVAPIAEETTCCGDFMEPGDPRTTASPISLTAGAQYGLLFLVKEGGGNDWGQVAMRRVGDPTPANRLQPIRGAILTGRGDPVGARVNITQQPQDATVVANESASFTVTAQTASPYTDAVVYQWYKNGAIIPGATSPACVLAAVPSSDNGAKITVLVAVPGASATSAEATLTVAPDNKPPVLSGAAADDTFTRVTVTFSEPVTAPTATTAANYIFGGGLAVSAAQLAGPSTVQLTTSQQAEDTAYSLSVTNVQDNAGNPVAPGAQVEVRSWKLQSGRVRLALYMDVGGAAVSDLLASGKYPGTPDSVSYLSGMTFGEPAFGNTFGDNYGAELKAFLIPEESGAYDFFIRSDDSSQLYLGTGAGFPVPGSDAPVAEEAACCQGFLEQTTPPTPQPYETTSTPLNLVAGQHYPILFLVKEGAGGDWGQVAWRRQGDPAPAASLKPLSGAVWYFGPPPQASEPEPVLAPVTVTNGTVTITWTGGGTLEFTARLGPGATWTSTNDRDGSYSEPVGAENRFFRVRR